MRKYVGYATYSERKEGTVARGGEALRRGGIDTTHQLTVWQGHREEGGQSASSESLAPTRTGGRPMCDPPDGHGDHRVRQPLLLVAWPYVRFSPIVSPPHWRSRDHHSRHSCRQYSRQQTRKRVP